MSIDKSVLADWTSLGLGSISPLSNWVYSQTGISPFYTSSAFVGLLGLLTLLLIFSVIRHLTLFKKTRPAAPEKNKSTSSLSYALSSVKSGFVAVAAFSFFINLLMLVTPLYMLQVYDRVLTSHSYETLIYLTVLAGGLIAFNALLELIRSRILVRIGGRLDYNLSEPVFFALFKQQNSRQRSPTLPISDLASVRNFLSGTGPNAFFDAPWTPIFIALIFVFHPILGIIATCGAILLFTIALISEFATRKAFGTASAQSREALFFADATVRNAEVVKGMGMLPQLADRWLEKNDDGLMQQSIANDRVGLLTAISKFIRPCLQVAMLGSGAYLVLQEVASPGVMIAASIIMGRALAPVEAAVSQWRNFISARSSYGRLKELLADDRVNQNKTSLPRPNGHLLVEDLTLLPPGAEKPVLNDVSFEVLPGQVLAVIGPSAAGKSTLARALVGVWPQSKGHIRLDGADLPQWIPEELGSYIGYLPQDVELFDGTVAENIARFLSQKSDKIIAAAKLAGTHDLILQLPNGYDTNIGPQGCILSGGQRQRLGLARALYNDPPLIVLDEPNASLDSTGEKALMTTIKQLKERGQTVVIISHRSNILASADQVLLLSGGRVEAFGEREQILPKLVAQAQPLRPLPSDQDKGASTQSKRRNNNRHA